MISRVNALTARWAASCSGESAVFAGAGVWPLLAFLASSAEGTGRAELEAAIGVDAATAAEAARTVLDVLNGSPAVRTALGLWVRADLPLNSAWLDQVPLDGQGELTGDPGVDKPGLDAWAAEQTGGLIESMPVRLDTETLLVLASALTVRTAWERPFEDSWWLFRGSGAWAGRDLAGLSRVTGTLGDVRVADTPGGPVTVLRVRGCDGVDVQLLLGEEDREPGEVLAAGMGTHPSIGGDGLEEGAPGPGLTVERVPAMEPGDKLLVAVPRFSVSSAHDLLELPEVFGLGTVTDASRGHFPGISSVPLAVQQARQDAVATFTAKGFEAAAVTIVGPVVGSAFRPSVQVKMVHVTFDRPFGFLATDRATGLVLAAGWVADAEPANPEQSSPEAYVP